MEETLKYPAVPISVTLATTLADSTAVDIRRLRGVTLLNTTATACAISVYQSSAMSGDFVRAAYLDVTLPASGSISLPASVFASHFLKLVSDNAALIRVIGAA